MNDDDHYSVLGVSPTASPAQIKERFRFLSHAYHPDKFATEAHRRTAEEEFKRINQAYQILSNASQRARYDDCRATPPPRTAHTAPPPTSSPPQSSPAPKPAADKSGFSWISTIVGIAVFVGVRQCNELRRQERQSALPPSPPAASQEVRRGAVKDSGFYSEFFAFTLPIPPNWEPMPDNELSERQVVGRELIGQQKADLQQRFHSAEGRYLPIFCMRPKSEAGWSVLPTVSAMAESILPNCTAEDYLGLAQRSFQQLQGVSIIPSSQYRIQCQNRTLTAVDFATRTEVSGHMSMLITIERGYALSFLLSAGDQQTLDRLKALAATINFQ